MEAEVPLREVFTKYGNFAKIRALRAAITGITGDPQPKEPVCGVYSNLFLLLASNSAHVQHLSVEEWFQLTTWCDSVLKYLKEIYLSDILQGLSFLLEASESVHTGVMYKLLNTLEGLDCYRTENPLLPSALHCLRLIAHYNVEYPKCAEIGRQAFSIGRARSPELRNEIIALAFDIGVTENNFSTIVSNMDFIDTRMLEFDGANVFVSTPSPAMKATRTLASFISKSDFQLAKKSRGLSRIVQQVLKLELPTQVLCFVKTDEITEEDLEHYLSNVDFWSLVFLGRFLNKASKGLLLKAWRVSIDSLTSSLSSAASYCLSRIIKYLSSPDNVDEHVVSLISTLLQQMDAAPILSPGSVELWKILNELGLLNAKFHSLKKARLNHWSLTQLKLHAKEGPTALAVVPVEHWPQSLDAPRTPRAALWQLSMAVSSSHEIIMPKWPAEPPSLSDIEPLCTQDMLCLVWFIRRPHLPQWARDSALNLCQDWWLSSECTTEVKQAISDMLVHKRYQNPDLIHYLSKVPPETTSEQAQNAIQLAPVILGSYCYQRDPHTLSILCQFLAKAPHTPERKQLTQYLQTVTVKQSSFSRLRNAIAPCLSLEPLLQLLKTTAPRITLTMIPAFITEEDASKLFNILDPSIQEQAATLLAERGASKSEMAARLVELGAISPLNLSTFVFAWYRGDIDKFPFTLFHSDSVEWKHSLRGRKTAIWTDDTDEDWNIVRMVRGFSPEDTRIPCDFCRFPLKILSIEQATMVTEIILSECVGCSPDERSLAISQAHYVISIADSDLGRRTLLRGACIAGCATTQLKQMISTMFPERDSCLALEILGCVPIELESFVLGKVSGEEHHAMKALISHNTLYVQQNLEYFFDAIHQRLVRGTSSLVFQHLMEMSSTLNPVSVDLERAIEWTRRHRCHDGWYSLLGRMQAVAKPRTALPIRLWTEELRDLWDHEDYGTRRTLMPFVRAAKITDDLPPVPSSRTHTVARNSKSSTCTVLGPQGQRRHRLKKPIVDNSSAIVKILNSACASQALPTFPLRNLRILSALIEASPEPPDPDVVDSLLQEDGEAGLVVVRAWYIKTGEFVASIPTILNTCCALDSEFLGLLCVDIYWSAYGVVLEDFMFKLQKKLKDSDLDEPATTLRQAAPNLSLALIDYEMGSTDYLREPLERSGLWRLADQAQPLYYSYESAWRLQQWDLPESREPNSECEILFNIFRKDEIDFQQAFGYCWENDSAAKILANIESLDEKSLNSSNCRQGRELYIQRYFPNILVNELSQSCRELRCSGDTHSSLKYALRLEKMAPENIFAKVEVANTAWSLGNSNAAIRILEPFKDQNPEILVQLAEWAHIARHHPPEVITRYFEAAENMSEDSSRGKIALLFAKFCDDAFSTMPAIDVEPYQRRRYEFESLKHTKEPSSSLVKAEQRLKEEENMLRWEKHRRRRLLSRAVSSYLRALVDNSEHSEAAGRVVALWLAYPGHLTPIVKQNLSLVPAISFIPWANQLVSRLAADEAKLESTLRLLILKMVQKHPHHMVWHLCNLRHVEMQSQALNDAWLALPGLDKVWDFSIQIKDLSHQKVDKENSKVLMSSLQKKWWFSTLPELKVAAPTVSIPLRASGNYSDIPLISSVDKRIGIANGLSAPKIITFTLSDGSRPQMLAKGGRDDLRQDAVMQQVIRSLPEEIQPRTYNIVPLGRKGGAIEVVQNTTSLMDAVRPLHEINDGRNYTLLRARSGMAAARQKSSDAQLSCWSELKAHIHPVLRLFFFEKFRDPMKWFFARQKWTTSTAQMSMVGYILGLGDRHCSNILIDTISGACVHIDLGIAFDQGQFLSIPERVPFRLTRDIVDGFGAPGTNGKFHAAACQVLLELCRQKVHILSVLDVLKYDALYKWPSRNGSSPETEWALRGVRLKLSDELSVEATVSGLVQQATSDEKLAFIYDGWAPFY